MVKVHVVIDGSYLDTCLTKLGKSFSYPHFFYELRPILAAHGIKDASLHSIFVATSEPRHVAPQDEGLALKQTITARMHVSMGTDGFLYKRDYRGQAMASYKIPEKGVDTALVLSIDHSDCDVIITLSGDADMLGALKFTEAQGKKHIIGAFKHSCSRGLRSRYPIIWLEEYCKKIAIPVEEGRDYGVVSSKQEEKNFAFIRSKEGKDYFMHASALETALVFQLLNVGDFVSFDVLENPDKEHDTAIGVVIVDPISAYIDTPQEEALLEDFEETGGY